MKVTSYIAGFDSAAAMLHALGRFLHGRDFPGLGTMPAPLAAVLEPLVGVVNRLPHAVLQRIYILGGWAETVRPDKLGAIRAEDIARWVVDQYPRRPYPAAMIGSSNGAAVHLCAALGIPWLPQTFLIPVRQRHVSPDAPRQALEAFRAAGRVLLDANPELQLHHMHDANQDRLMIQRMAYFRVKRRRLGATFQRFLEESLPDGATLFVLDCRRTWPTTRVGERHVFQHGALGGLTPKDYQERWDAPPADTERPEAEWGFETALLEDVEPLARRRHWRVERIVFEEPEHLSPLVADLYRWWYAERGIRAERLVAETFILIEPWWMLRTASVPLWLKFPVEDDAAWLARYLSTTGPWPEVQVTLFSHGVESAGWVSIDRWRDVLRAVPRAGFLGADPSAYPRDFASFVRTHAAFEALPSRSPMPPPLTLDALRRFLDARAGRYPVRWGADGDVPGPGG